MATRYFDDPTQGRKDLDESIPQEGVEYITSKDGHKRPMSWYKAQAEQAKKENPVQEPTILDALFNWP
ncbi:hypothetical protein [Yersinia aldovae]|uniref:Uncharacterized protein n=1 Tax=Yersinia aldovae TaxID=29483 RepID=A0ABM9STH6_YERAL|nr:hypothetical protein [Yersinia aldovae]CNL09500.1 Uncharacterised protein [Yersinia aldovae]